MMFRTILTFGLLLVGSAAVRGEQTPAETKAAENPSINFTDHVLPIFREHCLKCHNANDAEGGLAIDTYGGLMEGGGSGEEVAAGDAGGSRLYRVMTHDEEPTMPPNQDPLPAEKLEIIRQWIAGGLLENSGSKAKKRKGPSLTFASTDASGKPSVISMPEKAWRVPVVTSQRAAASSAISASPWAPLVAIAGQKQVALYNTDTSDLVGIIPYPEGIPQVVQFSLDGAYLLVAGGTHASKGTASLYDVKTCERLLTVGDELDTVFGADINDNMSFIALGGPQRIVRVFDTSSGDVRFELKKHTDWVYCVDYSPDGVLVASGDRSGGLHVWEADTGRLYLDLIGHKAAIRGISWRADSNVLVSASEDGTVKLWEMNGGKELKSFNAHGGGATGVTMAKDGRLVTCGKDKTVKLWKADGTAIATMPAFAESALEAVITHDGLKVIGGDWNGRAVMWTIADPKQAQELAANPPSLQDQQAALVSRVAELEKALGAATKNLTNQQKGLDDANAAHNGLVNKLSETKALLAKVNADKIAADKLLGELTAQKAAEESKLKVAQASIVTLDKKINDATAQLQAQQQQLSEATARRDTANKAKAGVVAEIAQIAAESDKLKADAVASLTSIVERELDIAAQQQAAATKEANAEADRKAAETTVAEFNKQIAAAGETIKQTTQQLNTVQAELKTTIAAINTLPAQIEAAQKLLDDKNAEVDNLRTKLAESQDENQKKTLAEQLAKSEAELGAAKEAQAAVEKQLSDANANKLAQDRLVSELTAKIAAATSGQQDLTNKRDAAAKPIKGFVTVRDVAVKEKDGFAQQLAQISGEIDAATKMKQEAVNRIAILVTRQAQLTDREQQFTAAAAREEAARIAAEAKAAELKQTIDATMSTRIATQAEVQTVTAKLAELTNKLKAQPGVVAKIAEQIQQHTAAIPNLEKQSVAAKQKVDAANAAVAAAKSAADAARVNADATKQRLEGIQAEIVAFDSYAQKLAAEHAAVEAAAAEKRKAVEPEAANASKISASLAARGEQLNQVAQSLAKLQAQLAELQKAQAGEQQTLDATQSRLKELQAAAETAEAEAQAKKQKFEFFNSVYGK